MSLQLLAMHVHSLACCGALARLCLVLLMLRCFGWAAWGFAELTLHSCATGGACVCRHKRLLVVFFPRDRL